MILLQLSFLDIVCEGSEVARQGNELAHRGHVIACRLFEAIRLESVTLNNSYARDLLPGFLIQHSSWSTFRLIYCDEIDQVY